MRVLRRRPDDRVGMIGRPSNGVNLFPNGETWISIVHYPVCLCSFRMSSGVLVIL